MEMIWFRYWPMVAVLIGMYWLESGWLAILLYHVGLILGVAVSRDRWRKLRWRSPAGVCAVGLIIGLLSGPFIYFALPWFIGPGVGELLAEKMAVLGFDRGSFHLFVAYFVTIHPVLEEWGWRGAIVDEEKLPCRSDVEFAAYHLLVVGWLFPGKWLLLVATLATLISVAWLWRQLRQRYGMTSVITFHAAGDLGVIVAAGLISGVLESPWK